MRFPPHAGFVCTGILEFIVAANSRHVVVLDNLSSLPGWLSDALARLSTGASMIKRRLYTDFDSAEVTARRPVVMTSIPDIATAPDLVSRSISVALRPLPDHARVVMDEFFSRMGAIAGDVLGALCLAMADAMRFYEVASGPWPRMAEFARWVEAAELGGGLPWGRGKFLSAYRASIGSGMAAALDAHPIVAPLLALLKKGPWSGTAASLLAALVLLADENTRKGKYWPLTAHATAGTLRRIAPALRAGGVADIDTVRIRGEHIFKIFPLEKK